MGKYKGQSGIFKVDNHNNMLAFIGGDKEKISEICTGISKESINGKEEFGLIFYKSKRTINVEKKINEIKYLLDDKKFSFIVIPHSKESIDFLIKCLNDLKTQF